MPGACTDLLNWTAAFPGISPPVEDGAVRQQLLGYAVGRDRFAQRVPGQLPGQRRAEARAGQESGVVVHDVDTQKVLPLRSACIVPSIYHSWLLAVGSNRCPGSGRARRGRTAGKTPRR